MGCDEEVEIASSKGVPKSGATRIALAHRHSPTTNDLTTLTAEWAMCA
jgi:hypothetical protein